MTAGSWMQWWERFRFVFLRVQFSGCQGRLDPQIKAHLTSSVVRLSGCLALSSLYFTHDFLGSEIMSDGPVFRVFGGLLSSAPYFIFSCHEFLSIKHCGRNGFMRSSLLFLPWIWGHQVMKRRGKIAFYSKIFELGVGHKHRWCIWGLFLLLSSILFFSWTQENVSSMFLHVTFNLTVQWGQFVYQSHVSSFGKDGYNVPY